MTHMHALQRHLWGQDLDASVWADYLDWKYSRNPYVDTRLIYVVIHAGEVVGMRGWYGSKWSVGQPAQELVSLCGGDLVIAPEHRNRGVFPTLTQAALNDAAERGYTYIFNFNPALLTSLGLGALGWRALGSPEPMYWESRCRAWGRGLARGAWQYAKRWPPAREAEYWLKQRATSRIRRARPPFARFDAHWVTRGGSRNDGISVSTAAEPEAMAELVERVGSDGRIRHVRDREFFTWRFCNPLSRYRFLFCVLHQNV
jgi:GNAT superfamily N-acetyltransferase